MAGLCMEGYRCLLVSADGPVARLMAACLGGHGMDCTIASARGEAIQLLRGQADSTPHLIIVDEETVGKDTTEKIAEVASEALVIRLAAEASECAEGHPWRCLSKPFSPPAFTIMVRAALAAHYESVIEQPEVHEYSRIVLDLCSGSGYSTCRAADLEGESALVVGIDRSAEAVVAARKTTATIGYRNIRFVAGDVTHLPFRHEVFAKVYGEEGLPRWGLQPEELGRAAREVRRVRTRLA